MDGAEVGADTHVGLSRGRERGRGGDNKVMMHGLTGCAVGLEQTTNPSHLYTLYSVSELQPTTTKPTSRPSSNKLNQFMLCCFGI